ncbi:class I SAM-dependent methyltransferase [Fodinibius saliphilus]|uniref:class I SAM-dependent methyltransferase n=1 Tax=Fodinibius saliphilus TaxID=1920650 RepID=UPI0011098A3F|nr:class I SAM-dependent methyltransferase [Fodinibius saliphilus]
MEHNKKEIEKEFSDTDLKELASQLRFPEGKKGADIGRKMDETNISMTIDTIDALNISAYDSILEIGHGNCNHLGKVLSQANNIRYSGLEISATMKREAQRVNKKHIDSNRATFYLYGGSIFPFEDHTFNQVMTVNTIYFWENPIDLLQEVFRVLKPGGFFGIGFAQKTFMKELPFVEHGFKLYDTSDVTDLMKETAFRVFDIVDKTEEVISKSGETVKRQYTVITLAK